MLMAKRNILILLACFFALQIAQADELFVTELNKIWREQNATNLIQFLDTKLVQSPNDPQVLFARGNTAAEMEQWVRGATNYVYQALTNLEASTEYSASNKAILLRELNNHLRFFEISIDVFSEPNPSFPQTNTLMQMELFQTNSNEFPYIEFLQKLDNLKEPQ
jgi:hypothetical protein